MPSLFCFTTVSLRASILATSMLTSFGRDAVLGEVVVPGARSARGLQQRLGGNAADIGAGAAQRGPPLAFFHSSMQATC